MANNSEVELLPPERLDHMDESRSLFFCDVSTMYYRKRRFASRRMRELIETQYFSPQQQEILFLLIIEERSLRDISKILIVSKTLIQKQMKMIIKKARLYFTQIDLFSSNEDED